MMMPASGLSIRSLMPSRRSSDEDLSASEQIKEEEPRVSRSSQEDGTINVFAVKPKHPNRQKRAVVPIIATSPLTHADILRPLPPIPSDSPRSSADSSCRCERHVECDCPLLSMKRRSPRHSTTPKEYDEDLSLLSLVNNSNPDDTVVQHVPMSRFFVPGDSAAAKADVTTASLSLGEHKDEDSKQQQSKDGSSDASSSGDILLQLIQETENAFNNAFHVQSRYSEGAFNPTTDVKITKAVSDVSDTPDDAGARPPTPPPKETRHSIPNTRTPSPNTPSLPSSSPLSSPPKDTSPVQSHKRENTRKSKRRNPMKQIRRAPSPRQVVKTAGPRWTLSENVSGLSRLFHRIEADEMLTPDQIEAFKQQRITKLQVDKVAAPFENDLADSPEDIIHIDDFPAPPEPTTITPSDFPSPPESSSAAKPGDVSTPPATATSNFEKAEEQPAKPVLDDEVPQNLPIEKQLQDQTITPPLPSRSSFRNNTHPTVSSRHVRSSSRRQMTELPIIPETSTAPRPIGDLSSNNTSHESLESYATSTSEYVYLRSSPYSISMPTFQHGPIRLCKSDLVQEMKLCGDEVLDWTAYQMAILGGAGDFCVDTDRTLYRGEEEDNERDDIADWWDSFNFEGAGQLVTRNYEASSPTSTLSLDEIPDFPFYNGVGKDHPNNPQMRWQEAQQRSRASGLQLDINSATAKKTDPSSWYLANGHNQLNDNEEKEVIMNRQSLNSLPPSPMLDLRVIRSDSGDDLDVVPMGYNLGHDLGDFLKWEAQHAYAGDFQSPTELM
ncbi:hypothetical protein F4808DRAFT_452016 [Astrocystis sublimbata]|nr:hypothetical protein F4808DRAFT_452016 [Astrocystis sublimbata]